MSEETARAISERSSRDRAALVALFDALMDWVDVQGATPEAQEFIDANAEAFWLSGLDGRGPDSELLLWLAEHPEIWRRAMPDEVVIVPRALLAGILKAQPPSPLGSADVEGFAAVADQILLRHAFTAARARAIDMEREPERIREHLMRAFSDPKNSTP